MSFEVEQNWIVLVDLEETLIKSWDEPDLIETAHNVKKFLDGSWLGEPAPFRAKLGLMSWAVCNDEEKAKFNAKLRPFLEEFLQFRFSDELILSMHEYADLVFQATNCHVSRYDLYDICKKEDVLFKLRKHPMFHHACVWLLDDVVANDELIQCRDNKSTIIIRNVKSMFD